MGLFCIEREERFVCTSLEAVVPSRVKGNLWPENFCLLPQNDVMLILSLSVLCYEEAFLCHSVYWYPIDVLGYDSDAVCSIICFFVAKGVAKACCYLRS